MFTERSQGGREGRTRGKCWICALARRTDRQGLPTPEHAELEKREERDMRQSRNLARRQRGEKGGKEAHGKQCVSAGLDFGRGVLDCLMASYGEVGG